MKKLLKKYPIKGKLITNIFVGDEKKLNEYKEKAGVYFLRDRSGKIMYIGGTGNLAKRVLKHIDGDPKSHTFDQRKNIHSINLFVIDEIEIKERWKPLEMDLIMVLNPPLNDQYTPEQGNKEKISKKINKYTNEMPENCKFEKWSSYEKCAFYYRKSLEYVILKASAEIEWDMNGEQLDWQEWDKLKRKYLKELALPEKEVEDIIWNKIISDIPYPMLNDLLIKKRESEDRIYNSITSEFHSHNYERPNRGGKEVPDVDSVEQFDSFQNLTLLVEKGKVLFKKLKNEFQGKLSNFHEIEIFHEKSIDDLKESDVWTYLMSVASDRIIDTPIPNLQGRLGEYVLALLTYDEWSKAIEIKDRENEENITISEYEE